MKRTTRLHGLVLDSQIPLHHDRAAPGAGDPDVLILRGGPVPPCEAVPEGRILLDMRADRQYYTAAETGDGYLLRFYGTCDVRISADLARVEVRPFEGADTEVLPVLLGGTVLAFVLAVRGEMVLHASAVQVGQAALAFVGASGMGKSTMGTLMCADGAGLITDDLLRLDMGQDPPTCALGSTELRLRRASTELAARFPSGAGTRTTGDDRQALMAGSSTTEDLPLAAIVVPSPEKSSGRAEVSVEQLDQMTAFLLLSRFPRLLGWEDEDVLRNQFQRLGDLIDRVPVYLARLPWGPPFPGGMACEIRQGVGLA